MAKFRQGTRLIPYKAQAIVPATPTAPSAFVDFTVYTSITFRMVSGSTVVAGAASGDANGNLTYNWGASDLAVVGVYAAYFIATDASGKTATYPEDMNLVVEVIPTI